MISENGTFQRSWPSPVNAIAMSLQRIVRLVGLHTHFQTDEEQGDIQYLNVVRNISCLREAVPTNTIAMLASSNQCIRPMVVWAIHRIAIALVASAKNAT